MKPEELRKLSESELMKKLDDLASEGMKLRFQKASMQLANPARIGHIRRDIARVQTVLSERVRNEVSV